MKGKQSKAQIVYTLVYFQHLFIFFYIKLKLKAIRIAITGPESTGKSTISQQLAQHYQTVCVPEYARVYIAHLKRPYTLTDIEQIAKGQMQLEDAFALLANRLLFCDTELTVTHIWAKHAFGTSTNWIEQELRHRPAHSLYLLMNIDLPWQPDPQREHPHLRQYLFDWYEQELIKRQVNYVVISGTDNQRLQSAIDAIEGFDSSC